MRSKKNKKWDRRFLKLARHISKWSKDPSTKTGAVIVDRKRRIVSVGYNGLSINVLDKKIRYKLRKLKYKMTIHSEINAIIFAERSLEGCTIYTYPFMSCATCTSVIIQKGIIRCVSPPTPKRLLKRWSESIELSKIMYKEANIKLDFITLK